MNDKFNIRIADWHDPEDQAALKHIRSLVFIQEQEVPPALEWDVEDATAIHLLVLNQQKESVACARLVLSSELNQMQQSSGKIGRMAVLANWRKQGIGTALLIDAIKTCHQRQVQHITLSAQVHAVGFYQRAGFSVTSVPYQDAGIPHVDMQFVNQDT